MVALKKGGQTLANVAGEYAWRSNVGVSQDRLQTISGWEHLGAHNILCSRNGH